MGVAATFAVQWAAGQADGLPALNDISTLESLESAQGPEAAFWQSPFLKNLFQFVACYVWRLEVVSCTQKRGH